MSSQNNWMRNKDGMGIWEHRGKVAVAGWGQSYIDRRWDGVSMYRTMGAWCIQACQNALDDAGLSVTDIDGIFTSKETRLTIKTMVKLRKSMFIDNLELKFPEFNQLNNTICSL